MTEKTKDQFGTGPEDFRNAATSLSRDAHARIEARAIEQCTNLMYAFGLPKEPGQLAFFAQTVALAAVFGALVDGWVAVSEKGQSTPADVADLTDALDKILRGSQPTEPRPSAGAYL